VIALDLFTRAETSSADMSPCGLYRYRLSRRWGGGAPMLFIGLNPSTANAEQDDPTIRRMVGFAKRDGLGAIEVVNLFAFRSTDPAKLDDVADPVGPDNDDTILRAARGAAVVVAAWGAHRLVHFRSQVVLRLIAEYNVQCLGTTKNGGYPRHPLYVAATEQLQRFGFAL
jgi:hypothetical protein